MKITRYMKSLFLLPLSIFVAPAQSQVNISSYLELMNCFCPDLLLTFNLFSMQNLDTPLLKPSHCCPQFLAWRPIYSQVLSMCSVCFGHTGHFFVPHVHGATSKHWPLSQVLGQPPFSPRVTNALSAWSLA